MKPIIDGWKLTDNKCVKCGCRKWRDTRKPTETEFNADFFGIKKFIQSIRCACSLTEDPMLILFESQWKDDTLHRIAAQNKYILEYGDDEEKVKLMADTLGDKH